VSAATRAKLSAAAKARWAKLIRTGVSEAARKKGGLTLAGRKAKPAFSNRVRYGRKVNAGASSPVNIIAVGLWSRPRNL
jgi:hypothetical protein